MKKKGGGELTQEETAYIIGLFKISLNCSAGRIRTELERAWHIRFTSEDVRKILQEHASNYNIH